MPSAQGCRESLAYKFNIMIEPEIFDNSLKIEVNGPKRKRRFKIFDSKQKQTDPAAQILPFQSTIVRKEEEGCLLPRRTLQISKPIQIVKIAPKSILERDFYGQCEQQEEFKLLEVGMPEYETVKSNKFIETGSLRELQAAPSVMFKNNEFVINETSLLYYSIKEIKDSYSGIHDQFESVKRSVSMIDGSMQEGENETEANSHKLVQLQLLLQSLRIEKNTYDRKIKEIDHRIENIEQNQQRKKPSKKSEKQEELKVYVEADGLKVEVNEEDDQFAESHYLPAEFITKYMEERKHQNAAEERAREEENQRLGERNINIRLFHPIFKIHQQEYCCLLRFLLEEFPEREEKSVSFRLLFRRGTTDLQVESVGEKADLQYKQNLLFLVKTSTGKRIGGFISNYLIEEESMEDVHAFLFTLEDQCHKFKIKEQCSKEAFSASKYYLITFSSDLMISSNCLEEENYCEWPSSYASHPPADNAWFAGDFEFMIEHIEVFEVMGPDSDPS